MKEFFLTEKQMEQAHDQLSGFHDAGRFQTTLALDDGENYAEIDVDGFSEVSFGFTDYTGFAPVTVNDQSLDLTGVRNYNPDLDIFEEAYIGNAQYNELINHFQYETSNF